MRSVRKGTLALCPSAVWAPSTRDLGEGNRKVHHGDGIAKAAPRAILIKYPGSPSGASSSQIYASAPGRSGQFGEGTLPLWPSMLLR
jgi:hypothetical protein